MSRRGDCYHNAVVPAFFSSFKSELADRFASCREANMELFDYVEAFYTQRHRQSSIGQIGRAEFEQARDTHHLVAEKQNDEQSQPTGGNRALNRIASTVMLRPMSGHGMGLVCDVDARIV
jgi:hypothetical protein